MKGPLTVGDNSGDEHKTDDRHHHHHHRHRPYHQRRLINPVDMHSIENESETSNNTIITPASTPKDKKAKKKKKKNDGKKKKKRKSSRGSGDVGTSKQVEVYGFVLWLSTFVMYIVFLLWALIPEQALVHVGITYYPSKYWALALPAYLLMLYPFISTTYICYCMYSTYPLDSRSAVTDDFAREMTQTSRLPEANSYSIPEIYDIPIDVVNQILYSRGNV